jgi:hypothetical protein
MASSPDFETAVQDVDTGVAIRMVDACTELCLSVSVHQVLSITQGE